LAAGLALSCMCGAATAQVAGFNPSDYGQARLPVRQSTGDAATYIDANKGAFEPIGELNPRDPLAIRARPIGRIDIVMRNRNSGEENGATCTGSLVSGDMVLTNHHCVPVDGESEPLKASILLDYLTLGGEGSRRFDLDITPVEHSAQLDYALLKVSGRPSATYGTVPLRLARSTDAGQSLLVFHHPLGRPKMMSRFRCFAVKNQPQDANFRHRCDTLGGSSGSLIFTAGGEVIALHKEGGLDPKDPSSFNTGTRFAALLAESAALRTIAGVPAQAVRPAQASGQPGERRGQPAAAPQGRRPANEADLDAGEMNDALKN
jgi:V8-like Glu-specific endopeptidase